MGLGEFEFNLAREVGCSWEPAVCRHGSLKKFLLDSAREWVSSLVWNMGYRRLYVFWPADPSGCFWFWPGEAAVAKIMQDPPETEPCPAAVREEWKAHGMHTIICFVTDRNLSHEWVAVVTHTQRVYQPC